MFVSRSSTVLNDWRIPDKRYVGCFVCCRLMLASQTLRELFESCHIFFDVVLGMDADKRISKGGVGPMVNLTHADCGIMSWWAGVWV